MKHYIQLIWRGVEPSTIGPFQSPESRLEYVKEMKKDGSLGDQDSIFKLEVDAVGFPYFYTFTDSELES